MINKVQLSNLATFRSTIMEPKVINYVYGGNGTGKTTLARFLADSSISTESTIEWETDDHEQIVVYNRDFIDRNFREESTIPGVFTLGKDSVDIQRKNEELRVEQKEMESEKEKHDKTLERLQRELKQLTVSIQDKCWQLNSKYGNVFAEALKGNRGSKKDFLEGLLAHFNSDIDDEETIQSLDELKDAYRAAYSRKAEYIEKYPVLDVSITSEMDQQSLLAKVITGKSETPIGLFIDYLKASDWVKQGLTLSQNAKGKCPFCQQTIPKEIVKEIEDFFDEEYERACKKLTIYQEQYTRYLHDIVKKLEEVQKRRYAFLQYEEFDALFTQLTTVVECNKRGIQTKIDAPSKQVEIIPIMDILSRINRIINDFNAKIAKNNYALQNTNKSREEVKKSIWRFFIISQKNELRDYEKRTSDLKKGIESVNIQRQELDVRIKNLISIIHQNETKLTSVLPTVNAINKILKDFGYEGFSIARNEDSTGTYKIVRANGSDALRTLSEGEYNFITFLYFYHLCFGNHSRSGISDNRIVIIDDPVSSLDSNALFVVSILIRNIIDQCISENNSISQVFFLTHNSYFHKEVTHITRKRGISPKKVAYFVIRKKNEMSTIVSFNDNPIKTSYETLWDEIRNSTNYSAKSIFNTMRRILEHYFQIIGGIKYEECINTFDGEDKYICKALIEVINDGSHSIFEDHLLSIDETMLDHYKKVFRMIFVKLNHINHYNMMMKDSDIMMSQHNEEHEEKN